MSRDSMKAGVWMNRREIFKKCRPLSRSNTRVKDDFINGHSKWKKADKII